MLWLQFHSCDCSLCEPFLLEGSNIAFGIFHKRIFPQFSHISLRDFWIQSLSFLASCNHNADTLLFGEFCSYVVWFLEQTRLKSRIVDNQSFLCGKLKNDSSLIVYKLWNRSTFCTWVHLGVNAFFCDFPMSASNVWYMSNLGIWIVLQWVSVTFCGILKYLEHSICIL